MTENRYIPTDSPDERETQRLEALAERGATELAS